MKLRRIAALAVVAIMLLGMVPSAFAAECPSEDAAIRNGGKHFWSEGNPPRATCTQPAVRYDRCVYCGAQRTVQISPALGHSWGSWSVGRVPTCTSAGTRVRTCSVCGETQTETTPANGHSWGSWSVGRAPTCTSGGTRVRRCSVCGETQSEDTPANGHNYGPWSVGKPATCGATGTRVRRCTVCGDTITETTPKTNDHKYGSWSVTKQATCTATGTRTRKCSVCGNTETQTIQATGHSYGSWSVTKQANCQTTGTRTRKCTVCGDTQTETIPKTDHSYGSWTVKKEATCTETGTRSRKCKVCGNEQKETIPKTPHSFGEWGVSVPATDHSSGVRSRVCTVCGYAEEQNYDPEGTVRRGDSGEGAREVQQLLADQGYINQNGVDGNFGSGTESAVKKFQTDQGLTSDGVAWPQTIDHLRHEFGPWNVISEMTPFSIGLRERTCVKCGYTEREEQVPEPILRRGDKGDAVRDLQNALNENGYDCGRADGSFGGKTEAAVKDFESANGIEPDGIAWPGVIAMLNGTGGPSLRTPVRAKLTMEGDLAEYELPIYYMKDSPNAYFSVRNTGSVTVQNVRYHAQLLNAEGTVLIDNDETLGDEPLEPGFGYGTGYGFIIPDEYYNGDTYTVKYYATGLALNPDGPEAVTSNPLTMTIRTGEGDPETPFLAVSGSVSPAKEIYEVGEQVIVTVTLTNTGDVGLSAPALQTVEVYGEGKDDFSHKEMLLEPDYEKVFPVGQNLTVNYTYTITAGDEAAGQAALSFVGSAAKDYCSHIVFSAPWTVTLPTKAAEEIEPTLNLTVTQTSVAQEYYEELDFVSYEITVTNNGDEDLSSLTVYATGDNNIHSDYLSAWGIFGAGGLAAGASVSWTDVVPITPNDAAKGSKTVSWMADGPTVSGGYARSNDVEYTLNVVHQGEIAEHDADILLVTKQISPEKPLYTLNSWGQTEDIEFEATVTNTGAEPVAFKYLRRYTDGTQNYSSLILNLDQPVPLEPGESFTITFTDRLYFGALTESDPSTKEAYGCDMDGVLRYQAYAVDPETEEFVCHSGTNTHMYFVINPALHASVNPASLYVEASVDATNCLPGETVTFTMSVTNNGSVPVRAPGFALGVESALDISLADEGIRAKELDEYLEPGETVTKTYDYVMRPLEVTGGKVFAYICAGGYAKQEGSDDEYWVASNMVPLTITSENGGEGDNSLAGLKITADQEDISALAGDKITVHLTATNTGSEPLESVAFSCLAKDINSNAIFDEIISEANTGIVTAPGESVEFDFEYEIPIPDTSGGLTTLAFEAVGYAVDAESGEKELLRSKPWKTKLWIGGVGNGGEDEPSVELVVEPIPATPFVLDAMVQTTVTVTNTGSMPLVLESVDYNTDDFISTEAWMSQPLEPGVPNTFTYWIRLGENDLWRDWTHRYVGVNVHAEDTGLPAYSYKLVLLTELSDGSALKVLCQDTTGMVGELGETLPVTLYVFNSGSVPLEQLTLSPTNAVGDPSTEEVSGVPAEFQGEFPVGESFEVQFNVVINEDDMANKKAERYLMADAVNPENGEHIGGGCLIEVWPVTVFEEEFVALTASPVIELVCMVTYPLDFASQATVDIPMAIFNYSDNPVMFYEIYAGGEDTYSTESWMSAPMEPGVPYQFNLTVPGGPQPDGYFKRYVTAEVTSIEESGEPGVPGESSRFITIPQAEQGASLVLIPANTDSLILGEGETITEAVQVVNNGEVELEDLQFTCEDEDGADVSDDIDLNGFDGSSIGPGESFWIYVDIAADADDVDNHQVYRKLKAATGPVDGKSVAAEAEITIDTYGGSAVGAAIKLYVNQITPEQGVYAFDENGDLTINYEATVISNAGEGMDFHRLALSINGDAFSTAYEPGTPVHLEYDDPCTFTFSVTYAPEDILPGSASEGIDGVIDAAFVAFSLASAGDGYFDSEAVEFEYKIGAGEEGDASLILEMKQTSPEKDVYAFDANDELHISYDATLTNNAGEPVDFYRLGLSINGDGMSTAYEPGTPVHLEPGESCNFSFSAPYVPEDILPGSASESIDGVINAGFQAFAWASAGDGYFDSNSVEFEYKIGAGEEGVSQLQLQVVQLTPEDEVYHFDANGKLTLYYGATIQNVGSEVAEFYRLIVSVNGGEYKNAFVPESPVLLEGEPYTCTFTIEYSEEDLMSGASSAAPEGIINATFKAFALIEEAPGRAESNEVNFEYKIGPDEEEGPALKLEVTQGYPGEFGRLMLDGKEAYLNYILNDAGKLILNYDATLTNNGSEALSVDRLTLSINGNEPTLVYYGDGKGQLLEPGESTNASFTVEYTKADIVGSSDPHAPGGKIDARFEASALVVPEDVFYENSNPVDFEYMIGVGEPETEGTPQLQLEVTQVTPPEAFYPDHTAIDFNYTLTNVGDADCVYGRLEYADDFAPGQMFTLEENNMVLQANAGNAATGTFSIPVDYARSQEGLYTVFIHALAAPVDGGALEYQSNDAMFEFNVIRGNDWIPPVPPEQAITVEKYQWDLPAVDPSGYVLNEEIEFMIFVTNTSELPMYSIGVYDPLAAAPDAPIAVIPQLDPHETAQVPFTYVVTPGDVDNGSVTNWARVNWSDATGAGPFLASSLEVTVPVVKTPEEPMLRVEKVQWDLPEVDPNGYVLNEEIEFMILLINESEIPVVNVRVFDALAADPNAPIAVIPTIAPHDTEKVPFNYIVTAADIQPPYLVTNSAQVHWTPEGSDTVNITDSNEVSVPVVDKLPEETIEVHKYEDSTSLRAEGYQKDEVVRYGISVTNTSDVTLYDVEVYDPLKGNNEDMLVDIITVLNPYETVTVYFNYTVTDPDVDRTYIENTAFVTWIRTGEEEETRIDSNTVRVPTFRVPPWEELTIIKEEVGGPDNGKFYVEDEDVTFRITVRNDTTQTFYDVNVTDPLIFSDSFKYSTLAPNEEQVIEMLYTVTGLDVSIGSVTNIAYVTSKDWDEMPHYGTSNEVTVYTGEEKDELKTDITVKKVETSKPANDEFYVEGEKITYDIVVTNSGETLISEVIVYDTLKDGTGEIASIENFYPTDSRTYKFEHTVTAEDVANEKVINRASGEYFDPEYGTVEVVSDPVISRTGKEPEKTWLTPQKTPEPTPIPETETKPAPGEPNNICIRTLVGHGEGQAKFTLDYCDLHRETADQVAKLLEAATTEDEQLAAWQQSIELWTEALNKQYDEMFAEAMEAEKPIILDERVEFYAWLACYAETLQLTYAEEPVTAAAKVSEQIMNKCADLCYELHTAPDARVDSLVTGRYAQLEPVPEEDIPENCLRDVTATETGAAYTECLCEGHSACDLTVANLVKAALEQEDKAERLQALIDAWDQAGKQWRTELDNLANSRYLSVAAEDRNLIAAERISYGNWLNKRRDFLNLLYPGRPEIVAEVLAESIRSHVLDLCVEEAAR